MSAIDDFKKLSTYWRDKKEDYVLYKRCFNRLFLYAKGFFLQFSDADLVAEDIAQITLTKFYEKYSKRGLLSISLNSPQAWVYKVTKNACLTELRKRNGRKTIEGDLDRTRKRTEENEGAMLLDYQGQLNRIKDCLANDRDFKILSLNKEGYKAEEIATMLSENTGTSLKSKTVSNRMALIKLKLNKCADNGHFKG